MKNDEDMAAFRRFVAIIRQLRAPGGCPWDREQTLESLSPHLIEEAFETVDAVRGGDHESVREELGDVFLLAVMLSAILDDSALDDSAPNALSLILEAASDKLVRRHPHVFGDAQVSGSREVKQQWEDIKQNVEGREKDRSALSGVSRSLPPLERAFRLQKKARKTGFDWPDAESVIAKVGEELEEVGDAAQQSNGSSGSRDALELELGDLLFSVINVARYLQVDPTVALHRANEKFSARFRKMEEEVRQEGNSLHAEEIGRMNEIWDSLKRSE